MSDDVQAVLRANAAFYDAFARRDLAAMDTAWVRHRRVACVHPGWPPLHDRDEIMASWQTIFANDDAPPIECQKLEVERHGEAATVICEEHLGTSVLVATNLFVVEQGAWRLWHHHAGPILRRLGPRPRDPLIN